MSKDFDYTYIVRNDFGEYSVKGVDTFPKNSVLAGQPRKNFLDSFVTLEEAQAEYPDATLSNPLLEPQNYVDHLPDTPDY